MVLIYSCICEVPNFDSKALKNAKSQVVTGLGCDFFKAEDDFFK